MRNRAACVCVSVAVVAAFLLSAGCTSIDVAHTRQFTQYDRVAIWANLNRQDEELFIPLYMQAFPTQTLVERRDVEAIIGEQDILPDRLDEETRARIRRILGVKALVYPSATVDQVAIKVVDTETGVISASVVVGGGRNLLTGSQTTKERIRKAIASLQQQVYPQSSGARGTASASAGSM